MADQIYELRCRGFAGRDFAECVFNWHCDGDLDQDFQLAKDLIFAIADGFAPNIWLNKLLACCSDSFNLTSVAVRRITDGGGNTATSRFAGGGLPGTVVSDFHANQGAACIIWIGDDADEKLGRNFIPGVPASFLDNGRWNATAYAAIDAFIAFHLAGLTGALAFWKPVVYSRLPGTWQDLIHGYLSPKIGTQRRREVPI